MTEEKKEDTVEEVAEEVATDTATEENSSDAPTEEKKEDAKTEEAPVVAEAKEEAPVVAEAKEEVSAEEDFEVPAEYADLIEKVEKMTVLELHGLVKVLEKKFGVSAAAVAVAGGADAGAAVEEKSEFVVHLVSIGDSKIGVIKAIKAILGLGLKEAKDLVESAPVDIKSGVKTEDAEAMKATLAEAGATVELK